MAHIEKVKRKEVAALLSHDVRCYDHHSNQDIRVGDKYLNYNFIKENPRTRFNNRLKECFVLKRDDLNVLVSIVITLPLDTKKEDERKFFQACFDYLEEFFGKENTISGIVHKDETRPHLHFKAIPVVWNEKKNKFSVNFDKKVNKIFFKSLHGDLESATTKALGYRTSITNGQTIGVSSVKELKKKTEQDFQLTQTIQDLTQSEEKPLFSSKKVTVDKNHYEHLKQISLQQDKTIQRFKQTAAQLDKQIQFKIKQNEYTENLIQELNKQQAYQTQQKQELARLTEILIEQKQAQDTKQKQLDYSFQHIDQELATYKQNKLEQINQQLDRYKENELKTYQETLENQYQSQQYRLERDFKHKLADLKEELDTTKQNHTIELENAQNSLKTLKNENQTLKNQLQDQNIALKWIHNLCIKHEKHIKQILNQVIKEDDNFKENLELSFDIYLQNASIKQARSTFQELEQYSYREDKLEYIAENKLLPTNHKLMKEHLNNLDRDYSYGISM